MEKENIEDRVVRLTSNFTKIVSIDEIKMYSDLYWGGNGVGDRWAKKKFNYCVVYSNKCPKNYSEDINDKIPEELLREFLDMHKGTGIIGIYVFSKKMMNNSRPIKVSIKKEITNNTCVVCGSNSEIVCDHKNDLYNDMRVLNRETQDISDFQPLCNHCNLQKRQKCKEENETHKIYSAKNIQRYKQYKFEFPWEKKIFDKSDIHCKNDTYWFDPVEFENKIYCYLSYVIPVINAIKRKVVIIN
jgi:hypothetical protein